MINTELYKIFYVVATLQNITKASEKLNISQPAVTKHIKNLEEQLNVILFIRTRKGVILTPIGQKIFQDVKNALTIFDNIENKIKNYNKENYGTIRIGISTTLVRLILLNNIKIFNQKYPNVHIEIYTDTTKEHIKLLQNGLLDFVVCKCPDNLDKDLEFQMLGETSYEFIANKEMYNHIKKNISLEELVNYPILLQKEPSNSYKSAKKLFNDHNINIESKYNIGSSSLLIDFTKLGYGIGYITKLYIEKELNNKELFIIKINVQTPKIKYGIITLKNNILSNIEEEFINDLKKKKDVIN